jgi:hypothetical protein
MLRVLDEIGSRFEFFDEVGDVCGRRDDGADVRTVWRRDVGDLDEIERKSSHASWGKCEWRAEVVSARNAATRHPAYAPKAH